MGHRKSFSFVFALPLLCMASPAFAWGSLGHRLVSQVASEITEDGELFWSANEQALSTFSNTPDFHWKKGSSAVNEKPTHWFHFDFYSSDGTPLPAFFRIYDEVLKHYSKEAVEDNGTGTWRVEQFYAQASVHLKAGQFDEALQFAGAMSHYIGDLSQPLHVTQNYDGQLTDQIGIHSWFESKNLETADQEELRKEVLERAQVLLSDSDFRASFEGDLMRAIFLGTARSLSKVAEVLENDKVLGRGDSASSVQLEIAKDRLADGAATYAMILSKLWREGGHRDTDRELSPKQPKWVAPDYSRSVGFGSDSRNNISRVAQSDISRYFSDESQARPLSTEEDCK